jgi:alanine racemase
MTRARPSRPVARIDHRALSANVDALLLRTDEEFAVADLRHDACGHGAGPVARTLVARGVDGFIVDARDMHVLSAEVPGAAVSGEGDPTLDPRAVFGLDDAANTPVMRLSGSVLSIKELKAGEGVSYGYTHRASADTRIALVTGGYAQGIVRALGDRADVRIGSSRHPIVGRVAMDVCVVDIGPAGVKRGDEVVFFGGDPDDPHVSEWSGFTGLTATELVSIVGQRALRERAE